MISVCANCGKEVEAASNENWSVTCSLECALALMKKQEAERSDKNEEPQA